MEFFDGITTIEELKQAYRKLAIIHHPDKGGNVQMMQALNREYEQRVKELSEQTTQDLAYAKIIEAIAGLEGIMIELVGQWIWVSGNTYAVRKELKAAGFLWAAKKKMWFWRPDEAKSHSQRELHIDKIREKYGSKVVADRRSKAISA